MQESKTKRSLIDSFDEGIAPALAVDDAEIMCNGGSMMYRGVAESNTVATAASFLLGNEFSEANDNEKRRRARAEARADEAGTRTTPRDVCVAAVQFQGLKRPTPKQWKE